MKLRVRAFAIWALLPCISLLFLFFVVRWPAESAGTIAGAILRSFYSGAGAIVLVSCVIQASIGTTVLWLMPIKRAQTGILTAIAVAIGVITISAWFERIFFGGFEANIGVSISALILLIPSCVGAGYAAILRARER